MPSFVNGLSLYSPAKTLDSNPAEIKVPYNKDTYFTFYVSSLLLHLPSLSLGSVLSHSCRIFTLNTTSLLLKPLNMQQFLSRSELTKPKPQEQYVLFTLLDETLVKGPLIRDQLECISYHVIALKSFPGPTFSLTTLCFCCLGLKAETPGNDFLD